jgi:hypothetical protein
MTAAPETEETETPQTPAQLLADLGELHTRTCVSPLPKHPAAMGWQAVAGQLSGGFTRALHALNQTDPGKAAEIASWFQGPFEDGPDPEEHTDWLLTFVAKDRAVLQQWVDDGRQMAEESKANTEAWEKERQDEELVKLRAQVKSVRDWATSHEYRWLHELLDGYGTHGGHL